MDDQGPPSPKKTRGEDKLEWLKNIKLGTKVAYEHIDGVPVGSNASKLSAFVGKLAKDGHYFPFDMHLWPHITDLAAKIEAAKDEMKNIFHWCEESDYWLTKSLNETWRKNKHRKKESSVRNTRNREQLTDHHTAGSKSYLRYAKEIEDETKKPATRVDIYRRTHNKSSAVAKERLSQMEELKRKAVEDGVEELLAQLDGENYSQVMRLEKLGRYRGVGIGVKSKRSRGEYSSTTSKNDKEVRNLKEEVEMLRRDRNEMQKSNEETNKKMDKLIDILSLISPNQDILSSLSAQH